MLTMSLDLGEAIKIALDRHQRRTGRKQTDVFDAVARVDNSSRNTIRALTELDTEPIGRKARQRAYLLAIALDVDPEEWGVSRDDLTPAVREMSERRLRALLDATARVGGTGLEPATSSVWTRRLHHAA